MIEHPECVQEEDLWDLVESAVSHTSSAIREHVAACPMCQARLDEIEHLHEGLESIGSEAAAPLPAAIGSYRILRLIGQGAGGVVYEAQQADPERRVALKVLRTLGPGDQRQLRAFQREIRALARLDHPAIATVHDAGRTEDGQVYFAMQLVDGLRLDRFCEEWKLDLRHRIRLVIAIANAVHHAHQHGILHRDLKPSNILVDEEGRPRVLDFGLARPVSTASSLTLSMDQAGVVGTLPYMSPEQARAEPDVDVRSDVYALGVILYQLVTGEAPYDVPSRLDRAVRVITEEEPPHPSHTGRGVPPELGDVVMKALAKDRERRYTSMASLREDLERFLAGDAVSARPSSVVYQLRVFARRNKALVGASLAVFMALAIGFVSTTLMWFETRTRGDETRLYASMANVLVRRSDPRLTGGRIEPWEELDEIVRRLENEGLRPSLNGADFRQSLGIALLHRGENRRAIPLLRQALEWRTTRQEETHPEVVAARYDYSRSLLTTFGLDQWREAGEVLDRNRELYEAGRIEPSVALAGSLRQLAAMEYCTKVVRGPLTSQEVFGTALEMVRGLPDGDERKGEEIQVLREMASYATEMEDCYRYNFEALDIARELHPDGWDVYVILRDLQERIEPLALAWDATTEDVDKVLSVKQQWLKAARQSQRTGAVIEALRNLAFFQRFLKEDLDTAADLLAEAIVLQTNREDKPWLLPGLQRHQAVVLRLLAEEDLALAREEEAGVLLERLLEQHAGDSAVLNEMQSDLWREALFAPTVDWAPYLNRLHAATEEESATLGQHSSPRALLRHLYRDPASHYEPMIRELRASGSDEAVLIMLEIEDAHRQFFSGERIPSLTEMDDLIERARAAPRESLSANDPCLWNVPCALRLDGLVRERAGDLAGALWRLEEAAAYRGANSMSQIRTRGMLGRVLLAQGKYDEAEPELRLAYSLRWPGQGSPALLGCDVARLLALTGRTEQAEKIFAEAFPVLQRLEFDPRFVDEVLEVYDPETGKVRVHQK